ncbi:MAG: fluoride efflux transporter CrcB [Sphaerochaetaceae bacterium]|nr:fluoride efflux transporter CrcB [Sphaerochaetaceae bacterium]
MLNLLFAGTGGFFGCLFRFKIDNYITKKTNSLFPIGIFIINLLGAFLLGVLTKLQPSYSIYALLGDGFLGAFTTFSTFMVKSVELFQTKQQKKAILYLVISIIFGVLFYMLGFSLF